MRLFRIDIRTGKTFKRTGSNFPHGSMQRVKADMTKAKLDILLELSNTGTILPLAIAMHETL